ncbi:MAG: hypothetical protein ACR2N3_09465 [Pyrinomonadaceae bacterium]
MRRIFPFIFVIFACAVCAAGQDGKTSEAIKNQIKSLRAEKTLELMYDKSSNVTKVLAFGEDFGRDHDRANNLNAFSFGITFFFVGNTLATAPDSFTMTFWAEEKKPSFAESNAMTIIVDGENLDVGNARYARKTGDPREFLNFVMPRAVLEKIVRGRDVQLRIGKAQFKFKPEHITLFSNLLAVSNPAQ